MSELPSTWIEVRLSDLIDSTFYGPRFSSENYISNGIPTIRTTDMTEDGHISFRDPPCVAVDHDALEYFGLKDGDLLVTRTGSIGRCALYRASLGPAIPSAYLIRVRLKTVVCSADYVLQYMRSMAGQDHLLGSATAVTQPNINAQAIRAMSLPLPPIVEQHRIVARLDNLLSCNRRTKETLDAIPPLLARFRQSALAAAFRGDLTAEWRAKNPAVEPAEELLKRIRAERRRRWEEAELAKIRAKGKVPEDDRWKEKYEEPEPVDASELPELPEGWAWSSLEEITLNFDGDRVPLKLADRDKRSGAYPYFGASGIIDTIDAYLFDGEFLLIAEDGANLLSRSSPIAFKASGQFWVNNHAHVVKPLTIPMEYLREYLNGIDLARYVSGTAQPKLTQKNMNLIPVPIAPPAEAWVIARLTDKVVEVIRTLIQRREELLENVATLDRAILAKAFRGELVPQDPNDEPASVLLKRIRAERENATKADSASSPRKSPAQKTPRKRQSAKS